MAFDAERLEGQREDIRRVMESAAQCGMWLTLGEIKERTGYGEASISAQLRHFRNGTGGYKGPLYEVEKRSRGERTRGLWEYKIGRKADA